MLPELTCRRGVNQIALRYYMQYFDMRSQNLVDSFRDLCKKLHLKAESQEIDRIIGAFSTRYFECNPTTVFGTAGVVHTVTGAMLMLNTDLHIADLSKHMSRSDFVRNAMRAVQENMPSGTVDGVSTPDLVRDDSGSGKGMTSSNVSVASSVRDRRPRDAPPALRSASAPVAGLPYGAANGKRGESSTSVGSFSYSKAWEQEAESALRVSPLSCDFLFFADRAGHLHQCPLRQDPAPHRRNVRLLYTDLEETVGHVDVSYVGPESRDALAVRLSSQRSEAGQYRWLTEPAWSADSHVGW